LKKIVMKSLLLRKITEELRETCWK
jgi:hypothetical protein